MGKLRMEQRRRDRDKFVGEGDIFFWKLIQILFLET